MANSRACRFRSRVDGEIGRPWRWEAIRHKPAASNATATTMAATRIIDGKSNEPLPSPDWFVGPSQTHEVQWIQLVAWSLRHHLIAIGAVIKGALVSRNRG